MTEQKRVEEKLLEKTLEPEVANRELQRALVNIETLRGMIPICAKCKKLRDDEGS